MALSSPPVPGAPRTLPNPAFAPLQALAARLNPALPVAVAYSGGADSTALLRAAAQLWPGQVRALHVHHGLQSAANDFQVECVTVCQHLGVPLSVLRVHAQAAAGQSPEDAARIVRYSALAQGAQAQGCAAVLLGQHADDQAETVLMALGRGAGLPGLAAMPERFERHGREFLRPLLGVGAPELRQWLQGQGHSFVDDPSNADPRFTRNKLRARLLPALAEALPHFRQTLARSARHAAQAQTLLEEVAAEDLLEAGMPPRLKALQALSPARQANALRHWLASQHRARPSAAQLEQLQRQIAACTTRGHRIELRVAQGQVRREGDALSFRPSSQAD